MIDEPLDRLCRKQNAGSRVGRHHRSGRSSVSRWVRARFRLGRWPYPPARVPDGRTIRVRHDSGTSDEMTGLQYVTGRRESTRRRFCRVTPTRSRVSQRQYTHAQYLPKCPSFPWKPLGRPIDRFSCRGVPTAKRARLTLYAARRDMAAHLVWF